MFERSVAVATCLFAGFACAPSSPVELSADSSVEAGQQSYTFAGCAEADGACPRYGTIACALTSLAERHAGCAVDSDCALVVFDGQCTGLGSCPPPAINKTEGERFRAEAATELSRYCATNGGCNVAGSCAVQRAVRPTCIAGVCQAL